MKDLHPEEFDRAQAERARPVPRRLGRVVKTVQMLAGLAGAVLALAGAPAQAQQYATAGCVATLESRSVPVDQYGMFALPNIPTNPGRYRVRVICPQPDGTTLGSTSDFLDLVPNGVNALPLLPIGPLTPQSVRLHLLNLHTSQLSSVGATIQLQTQAVDSAGYASDATLRTQGSTYDSSNLAVATVSADGLVTATGPGTVVITVRNDGLVATIMLTSFASIDSDGDGMPDAYEIANGLNPYDPTDANGDMDHDGLTNLQEFQLGTNPRVADTDGDGLTDGQEVALGTNPLVADTDGDGLSDGDEVRLGTNPLNPDTDGDGIPDGVEVKLGLNPLVADVTTTVTGHVTKGDGSPYPNATVVLLTYFTATTDTTGAFTLQHIPTTLGSLVVSARVVTGTTVLAGASKATAPLPNATTDVGTISLGQNAGQVSGTVTGPDSKPVNLAQVTVVDGADTRITATDSNGLYVVSGLQAGTVVVAVFDPATSLRGQSSGTLSAAPLSLNVRLGGFGTVAGTVRTPAGAAVGAGVSVAIAGALNSTTLTDTLGHYSFPFVPLGSVVVDATDSNGNHGRSSATVTATAQNLNLDVQFLGRGTVTGTVTDGTSAPVAGAAVSLINNGIFGQRLQATTNSLGQYTISNVFVGSVAVSATYSTAQTGGSATAVMQSDGQTVTANIMLQPTATVTGVVHRADGTTIVPNAIITLLYTGFTTTTDSTGTYTLPNVPVGNYNVRATDPQTSDLGQANAALTTAGATVTANVTMQGLGTVVVTVQDGGGAAVAGALVTINAGSPFSVQQNGVTAADGTLTINQQLAGTLSVQASNPVTGLAGSAQVVLAANQTASVTVTLQSAGTIQGTVYRIDGVTPIAAATVRLNNRTTQTGADGKYVFTVVPSGQHHLDVIDLQGNVLAYTDNATITTQGQVVTANFIIIGRGTVTGLVTDSNGNPVAGIPIQITSNASGAGNAFGGQSDVNGNYSIPLVPAGTYTVIAQQHTAANNSYGTATGNLPSDGATSVTNVQLSSTVVPSVSTFTDANGLVYPIGQTGALSNGAFTVFAGDSAKNQGGSVLSLVSNGVETPFTGATFSKTDLAGQQISIEQDGLDGLNVTRRIYIPGDGYFARYLELLTNPSKAPVTVGLKLTTNYRDGIFIQRSNSAIRQQDPPHILLTSSGDNILNIADPNTPDRWVTVGGSQDIDPFLPDVFADALLPPVAEVFDGPGAVLAPSTVTFGQDANNTYTALTQRYNSITVPAGGTVSILHFVSQENVYAAANAAAARLGQLPPEALAGIYQAEIGTIANFKVPADLSSPVTPLPSLTNTVSGFVYAADGATPVPYAGITLQGSDPIFSRLYIGGSAADGSFSFTGTLHGIVITPENFTLTATHPLTQVISPPFTGTFPAGAAVAAQNILFSNTGTFKGTVSRGPTVLNVSGTITFAGGSLAQSLTIPVNADGTYVATGMPVGTYTITANVTNTFLSGQTTATLAAGQTLTVNVTIGESGNVQGVVTRPNGSLAIGDVVNLRSAAGTSSTQVDTSGHYMFTDLPIGTYTVDAYDQQSNSAGNATVTVAINSTATANLALVSSGTVNGTVTVNDGSSVAGLTITLTSTTSNGTQTLSAVTNSTGGYTFTSVNPGTLQLRTTTPAGLQGVANGSLALAGQTITLNLSLTAAGSLSGTVYQADGKTPAAGIQVTLSPAPLTGSAVITTDAAGHYSYSLVAIGGFTVYATNTATGDLGQASGQIQTNGQARVINVTLNGTGTLTVIVQDANSRVVANASVTVTTYSVSSTTTKSTDSTGTAVFSNIFAGQYGVSATDPVSKLNNRVAGTLVAGSSQSITVKLQAAGTIKGVVYGPDGTTPVAGATVSIDYGGTTTTAADGSYSFLTVQLGYYTMRVADSTGRARAVATGVYLQNNGDTLIKNFTFTGLGTVKGTVRKVDGTVLNNATLQLYSLNTVIGGYSSGSTGGDGTYSFSNVPTGNFTVTVVNLDPSLSGFGQGKISSDGDTQTVNIQLTSSTVTLPVTLNDADGFGYTINTSGGYSQTTGQGALSAFYSAQTLTVAGAVFGQGGAPVTSISSLNGQQVEINQPSLGGLNVTRKIYVPTNGYFSRRLDVLQNTSSSPITVAVSISGAERYVQNGVSYVIKTSNGTATVDSTIHWAVDDDDQGTLPYPRSQPALANVFSNTGATTVPDTVTSNIYYGSSYALHYWYYTYSALTVPANSTVSLLTLTAQEATSSTAITAAQRLVQVPAEVLTGLSTADLANVVNFKLPAAPLAAIAAPTTSTALTGHVFAGDGTTPIPLAVVYAQSTDLYFGSGTKTTADATGAYTTSALVAPSYSVQAVDPGTNVASVAATGTFAANQATQTQDIPFTGTGILQGLVKGSGMTTFAPSTVYVTYPCANSNQNCGSSSATYGTDGVFKFLTLPAGNDNVQTNVYSPQGGSIYLSSGVNVAANTTTQFTFNIPATGIIAGTVQNADGTLAVGARVSISGATKYFGESTVTDANGHYVFSSVPLDNYTVYAFDASTSNTMSKPTTVTTDVTSTVNFTFIGHGTVVATVKYANGNTGQNVVLYISTSTVPAFTYGGYSDATTGQFTFQNVPTGSFSIRAYYPNQSFYSTTTNTLSGTGTTVQQAVTLTPVGTVSGKVTNADGSPATSAYVQIADATNQYATGASTDSAGSFAFFPVPADRTVSVFSNLPGNTSSHTVQARVNGVQVPGDGQTATVTLRYPGFATLKVSAVKTDNTPYTSGYIYVKSADGFQSYGASVDATGSVTFTNVSEGSFVAWFSYQSAYSTGTTLFSLGASDDGTTKTVVIHPAPTGTLKGKVYGADGTTPLLGNYVVVATDVDTGNSHYVYPSDTNGYEFDTVQFGPSGYSLAASLNSNPTTKQTVTGNITADGQVNTKDFTLLVSVISGTVYLNDGTTAVPYANVYGVETINGVDTGYNAQADQNGNYQIAGPLTGSLALTVTDSYGVVGTQKVALATDTDIKSGINIRLGPTGTVQGHIYDSQHNTQTYTEVNISSTGGQYGYSYNSATTDTNGYYTVSDVPIGNVTATVYFSSTQTQVSNTGQLSNAGDTLTLDIGTAPSKLGPGAKIFGTVYDANQNPNAGATVTATDSGSNTYTAVTDTNGMYSLNGMAIGSITAVATLNDGTTKTMAVTGNVPDDVTPVEIDLGLSDPGTVSGTIYDVNHKPVSNVDLSLETSGTANTSYLETNASDGTYGFGQIAPGTITITVLAHGTSTVLGTGTTVLPYGGNVTLDITLPQHSSLNMRPSFRNGSDAGSQMELAGLGTWPLHIVAGRSGVAAGGAR